MATFGEWQARSARQAPEPGISDQLVDVVREGAGVALEAAMPVFDLMARPQTALSEAWGAHKSGEENELLAALRGFTGGWDEARYGTFGEQIVPHEEGEDLGRAAARFGVDVVTDPVNLLFFTGAGRKVVSKGLQKVASPALKRVGGALKTKPWAQRAGRLVVPYSKLWGMFGGEAGQVGGKLATEGFETIGVRLGKMESEMGDMLKRTGLMKDADKRKPVSDVLEGKAAGPVPDDIAEAAGWFRAELDRLGSEAEQLELKMFNPQTRELEDFARIPNYVPRMFRHGIQDELEELMAGAGTDEAARAAILSGPKFGKFAEAMAKKMNISKEQAQRIIHDYGARPRRVGHLEIARTEFPEELVPFLERDPVEWFTRYIERAVPRIEMAKRFGTQYEELGRLLGASKEAGMVDEISTDLANIISGEMPRSKFGLDELMRGALAIQTIGKLGPVTSLMNLGQQVNTGIKEGIGKMFRSMGRELIPAERRRHAFTYVSGLRDETRRMTGAAGGTGLGSRLGRGAQGYLKFVGFTPIEQMNRMGSSIAGVMGAEDTARRWAQLARLSSRRTKRQTNQMNRLRKKLDDYGVSKADRDNVERLVATGQRVDGPLFKESTNDTIGYRASQVAQHPTNPWEMPPAWRSPEMRVFLQFKRFAYNQSRFLFEQVGKPAYKWLETAGEQGDIGPLLRTFALLPPAGVALGQGREAVKNLQAWMLGAKERPSYYDFENHPTMSMLRGMMYVGSFGVAGDLLERAYRSGLSDYFLGPTVGDLFDVSERLAAAGFKQFSEGETPTMEDMLVGMHRVVGRGPLGVTPTQLSEASTRRGLPGAIRRRLEGRAR